MSVIHSTYPSISENSVREIALQNIVCDSNQFYKRWTTNELLDVNLADCPTKMILEPLSNCQYRLLFGIKYFLAANVMGITSLPALVLQSQHDQKASTLAIDIFDWEHLDDIECAQAYQWLKDYYQYTTEQIATICSVSRPVISNQLRLLNLPLPIQGWLRDGSLSKSHCFLLLKLPSETEQLNMAKRIIKEMPSVREVKMMICEHLPERSVHETTAITVNETTKSIHIQYTSEAQKNALLHLLQTQLCNL